MRVLRIISKSGLFYEVKANDGTVAFHKDKEAVGYGTTEASNFLSLLSGAYFVSLVASIVSSYDYSTILKDRKVSLVVNSIESVMEVE